MVGVAVAVLVPPELPGVDVADEVSVGVGVGVSVEYCSTGSSTGTLSREGPVLGVDTCTGSRAPGAAVTEGNWTCTAPVPLPPMVTSWPGGTVIGVLADVAPLGAKLTWMALDPSLTSAPDSTPGEPAPLETISRFRTASEPRVASMPSLGW